MSRSRLLLLALVALGVLVPSADAQASLPDQTALVATPTGLYVVPPDAAATPNSDPVRFRVATPADFGYRDSLPAPELAWIRNTDTLLVTTTNGSAAPGGLHRVRLDAAGSVLSIELLASGPFRDVDTSGARDEAWVLDGAAGHVLRLQAPDIAPPGSLEPANDSLPAGEGGSLAVVGNEHPFGLWVRGQTHIWRVPAHGGPAGNPFLTSGVTRVGSDPLADGLFIMIPGVHVVGRAVWNIDTGNLHAVDVNLSPDGDCKPALHPRDFALDGAELSPEQGLVVVAGEVDGCIDETAEGGNHLVWLPRFHLTDDSNPPPRLLTPVPLSGITGSRASLDLVRTPGAEIAHVAYPQVLSDGARPLLGLRKQDGELRVNLSAAPALTPVLLSLRVAPPHAVLGPVPLLARLPGRDVPLLTDARGQVDRRYPVPADPALTGVRVVTQILTADAGAGPGQPLFAPTQKVVFVVGTL